MNNKGNNVYDIDTYTDAELFDVLDVSNPTDRELEARILFLIHKYKNMQNKSGDELAAFFTKIYARFFDIKEDDEDEEKRENRTEGFTNMQSQNDTTTTTTTTVAPTTVTTIPPTVAPGNSSTNIGYVQNLDYSKDNLNPLLKQTIRRIISIDSQYRENKQSLSTDFTFNLSDSLKDVVSLKLYSIQIPYTWYTINNNYGSNFFYIKGNAPGIDNGNHDYQIDISAGNYTPGNLVTAINTKIGQVISQTTDLSFGKTNLFYNPATSLITTTVDITNIYNENSYYLRFPNKPFANDVSGISPGPRRYQTIPAYLGFNQQEYFPFTVLSTYTLPYTNNGSTTYYEDSSIRKYYVGTDNNYFTIIKYIGPGEYVDGSSNIDVSFQINLSITADVTRNELLSDINNQLQKSTFLTSDSQLSRLSNMDPSSNHYQSDYFQLVVKPNRYTTNNVLHSKMLIQFPTESVTSGYQPIWTGLQSCFQFKQARNELNTIVAETPPIKQQASNFFINSNPYIYLRCVTPGFQAPGANAIGIGPNADTTLYPYLNDTCGNQISRTSSNSYVLGPDMSSNDYIFQIPNSTVVGYTLSEYIQAINGAIKLENDKTKTTSIITGDFTMAYTSAQLDNTSKYQMNIDLTKTFTQSMYSVSLQNSFLSTQLGLQASYVDLSSQNQFHSSFDLLNSYTFSGDTLATIYPSPKGYGNRLSSPYVVKSESTLNRVTFNSFQELQTAINNRFQSFVDPSDGTNVLSGTNIALNYNRTTNKVDCSFTVFVNKHLTQNNYKIQFIDPSMIFYKDFYTATKSIALNSIFNIDTSMSYYTDLSSCFNSTTFKNAMTGHQTIPATSVTSLNGSVDGLATFTDLSSAFHYHDATPQVVDASYAVISPIYYTDLSTCYNTFSTTLFSNFVTIADASLTAPLFVIDTSMQYYRMNPAPSSVTYNQRNYDNSPIYLMDNSTNYYHDLTKNNYMVDPSLITMIDGSTVYIRDLTLGNIAVTGRAVYVINSSSVIQSIPTSNGYVLEASSNYLLNPSTNQYWFNTIDLSAISQRSIYYVGTGTGTGTGTRSHLYRTDASALYVVDSATRSTQTVDSSNIYVLDHSANYYYNKTASNYVIDASLIQKVGAPSLPTYFVSNGTVYTVSGNKTYSTYAVNGSSRIYSDLSSIYLVDSSQNIYVDTSLNPTQYLIDPTTQTAIRSPSVYIITSLTVDSSLNQRITTSSVVKPEIIRVDASNIYLIDKKLPYFLHPIYTSTNWYTNLNVDLSMIEQEYDLSLGYTSNTSYSTINATAPVTSNSITIDNTNNTFTIVANEEGVYSEGGENNIVVTIPNKKYTRTDLITAINNTIQNATSTDASGSFLQIYVDPVTQLEYTKFRVNVNRVYTGADYRISFYDPYSFVKCTLKGSSIKNTTWDTTLGWILGYRSNTVYALSEYGSRNQVITLTGDTGVSTNLYNYFLICLDDYNQNHLNDGLVTVSSKDVNIPLPSYASRAQFQCDPATGKKTYNTLSTNTTTAGQLTQHQIYAATEIANSKSQSLTTATTTGNTISSTSYGLGPFVQDVFGFIPMKVAGLANGSSYVDYSGTLQNQDRTYFGPVNIQRMSVRLVSDKGDTIDLNGANWSFSLICEQLYKSSNPGKSKGGGGGGGDSG